MPVKRGKVKGRGRGVEKTRRGVEKTNLCPIVDLPGYIVNEEANGALVYKRCRGVGAGMLVPPADSSINTGPDFTDSDDSNESMTLPDYENGDPILVNGKPFAGCRIEPHKRGQAMRIFAEGLKIDYIRRVRKYKRYLRRIARENEEENRMEQLVSTLEAFKVEAGRDWNEEDDRKISEERAKQERVERELRASVRGTIGVLPARIGVLPAHSFDGALFNWRGDERRRVSAVDYTNWQKSIPVTLLDLQMLSPTPLSNAIEEMD